uniref:Uncharacterized protein n=1 Tax=Setaria viridis TaxID=4556 RepID=A0A4V6D127_SETVI|nr:hypothetical protein SEVIR_9G196600v2 [Setaria viridis]
MILAMVRTEYKQTDLETRITLTNSFQLNSMTRTNTCKNKGRKININMGGRYIELIFQYLKGPGHRNASSAYNSESTTVNRALCPSSCSFLPCNGLPTNIYLPQ